MEIRLVCLNYLSSMGRLRQFVFISPSYAQYTYHGLYFNHII